MSEQLLLDIIMTTYNQENYIAEAIQSVLLQKVNFPFRLIIGEDCSTDKTNSICKKYAEKYPSIIILLENNKNIGLVKNYKQCFEKSDAKYIAFLEGDDYWTDPNKIMMQIRILESDKDVGLVHANCNILIEEKAKIKQTPIKIVNKCIEFQGYIYNNLIHNNFIYACSAMFRRDLISINEFDYLIQKKLLTIDYHLWLTISLTHKISYISENVGVYRVSMQSISNNFNFEKQVLFAKTKRDIIINFISKNPIPHYSIKDANNEYNMSLLLKAISSLDIKNARKYIKEFSVNGIYLVFKKVFLQKIP